VRYEDLVGKNVTMVLGGGVSALKGRVTGGDGEAIFLDVEHPTGSGHLVRHRVNDSQVVYVREDES
jgi:hypothetical protein